VLARAVGVRSMLPMMVLRPFVCIGLTRDLPHLSRGVRRDALDLVRGSAGSCRRRDVCSICASAPLDHDNFTR
jgi:hypothetical protein